MRKYKISLMYHCVYRNDIRESGFLNESAFMYKIKEELFEEHVKSIENWLRSSGLPLDSVEFTFDDGGISFYTLIAPILEKYGLRGIFFISTKYLNTPNFQVKELDMRGHIIASHSHTHPHDFASLPVCEKIEEWKISMEILEDIVGHKIFLASVPNGDNSPEVNKAACLCGIQKLYTSVPTMRIKKQRNDMELIGRYVVYGDTTTENLLSFIQNKNVRKMKLLRWQILSIAKLLLGNRYNMIKTKLLGKK